MKVELWVAVLVALIAVVPGVLALIRQLMSSNEEGKKVEAEIKKLNAEVADLLTESALILIAPLTKRVHDLECNAKKQDKQIKMLIKIQQELCDGIKMLMGQLEELGHTPVFTLNDKYCEDVDALIEEISS